MSSSKLIWTDATGPTLPDGYFVQMSDQGFEAIAYPVDGIPVADDFWNRNVGYGVETVTLGGLIPEVVYYFKIFSYRGIGKDVLYKINGSVPEMSVMAR